jgi:hypothetical protein
MWRTSCGERILQGAEWELFREGLQATWDDVETAIENDDWGALVEFEAFDLLQPNQQLALLCEVGMALKDPSIPWTNHIAHNEATIATIFSTLAYQVEMEIDLSPKQCADDVRAYTRKLILEAHHEVIERDQRASHAKAKAHLRQNHSKAKDDVDDEDDDDGAWKLPTVDSKDMEQWKFLLAFLADEILWDDDYDMTGLFVDRDPLGSRELMERMGIAEDYYTALAPDPTDDELVGTRQQLGELCGRPGSHLAR